MSIGDYPNLLPITALVAVILFVIRESLDIFKQKRGRNRRLAAAKAMMGYESERINYAKRNLFAICKDIESTYLKEEAFELYSALLHSDGSAAYRRMDEETESLAFGIPIPRIPTVEISRWLPLVAELDQALYDHILGFYVEVAELEHLRSSLMKYLLHEEPESREWLTGFVEYAIGHEEQMTTSLLSFYKVCTGKNEIPVSMR
jgi:hypothetical protein